jgi:hypothetical protein
LLATVVVARRLREVLQGLLPSYCKARQDKAGIKETLAGSCRVNNFCRQVMQMAPRAPAGMPA